MKTFEVFEVKGGHWVNFFKCCHLTSTTSKGLTKKWKIDAKNWIWQTILFTLSSSWWFLCYETSCLLQCCTDNPEIVMMNVKEYFCIHSANQAVKVLAISKG